MVYNKNTEKAVEENKVGERKTNLGPKRNGCIRKQKVRQIEKEQTVREKKKKEGGSQGNELSQSHSFIFL